MAKSHVTGWTSDYPTPAQLKEFFAQIESGRITKENLQKFLRGEVVNINELIADWQEFYQDVFGLEFDFSEITIPDKKSGFDRLIIVAPGMTTMNLFNKCSELFNAWTYTDKSLDEVIQSDRTAKNGAYAIWLRDRIEADEEMKNISANLINQQKIITLEERLLYELKFYKETGQHLDVSSITLCAGSRYDDGNVPSVNWGGDELEVYCYDPAHQGGNLRARVAVV